MNRNFLLLAFLVFFLSSPISLPAEDRTKAKVGAILPLSGPIASIGQVMREGLEMARADARHVDFTVIYEDDKTANRIAAVTAARKLTSVDKVDAIYNAYASSIAVIAPALSQTGTPSLVIWDSNQAIKELGKYVIGFGYSNERSGEVMARHAIEKLSAKKAAVIPIHDEWSELIANSFIASFKSLGGEIVLHEVANRDATDFRTLLVRARVLKADVLYAPLYGPGMHSIIRQAREIGFTGALLTGDSFADSDIADTGPSAEGLLVSQIWFQDQAFKKKYAQFFPESRSSEVNLGYTALAYDSLMVLDALAEHLKKQNQTLSAATIATGLPGFCFKGVLGQTCISKDRAVERWEKILVVKNGRFEPAPY